MSILTFLVVLLVLVLVHELGHFAIAKWTGMRVDEFGIGFPPRLFSIRRGETEYTINLFPIGGFVKIHGEDAVLTGEAEEDSRAFTAKSSLAQAAVLVAGVTMNVLFAWVLIACAFGLGVKTAVSEADASERAVLAITNVLPGSPADTASLSSGAVIREVTAGGESLTALTPSAFSAFVAEHGAEPLTIAYSVKGEMRATEITPATGIIADRPEQAAIGVALVQVDTVAQPFFTALSEATVYVGVSLRDITVGIVSLIGDALTLKADFSQVAGPVGIVSLVGEASSYGLTSLLMFTAFISLNLAVINIFPFPALDGGRLLFVVIEAIRQRPINPHIAGALNTIGFFLLILLMVAVTWHDIARL